jgi:SAM-dependent methyltransferase
VGETPKYSKAHKMIDLDSIADNLEQKSDGTWGCKFSSPVSYPEWGNESCFNVEDVSFWFQHRNACILEAIKQFLPAGPLFDIGGGNGVVAKAVQDAGFEVVMVEPGSIGTRNAMGRGVRNVVCAELQDAGFRPLTLGAVGLFDVLEHIADDRGFLQTLRRYLRLDGRAYLSVPAYKALWSHEDVDAGHYRRYSRRELLDALADSGWVVEYLTGFFQFLPPVILIGRAAPFRLGIAKPRGRDITNKMQAQHQIRSRVANGVLGWFQQRELAQIHARRELGFGGSWLVVARKA